MRVAHLTTVDMSLRYLVLPQLLDIRDRGGEAIGISSSGPFVAEIEAEGIRHVALPTSTRGMHPLADLRAAFDLWVILRRERLDVLHTHNPKPGLYGRVLGRLAGVPVVANTVHGLYATEDDRTSKRLLVYGLEAVAARFSDVELIQSREDFELLTRSRISPQHKTRLLGNGVDVARFRPEATGPDLRRQVREGLGIAESDVVVGMVGRLVAEKGWMELFAAAAELGSGYTYLAIGPEDPEKADALPQAALEAAEENGVLLLGMRTDMVDLYSAMDIFVLPSYREGFPRAAMEAAASGLPVIATDIRGCREVVDDGVNGSLVPVGDADALAAAIEALGENPEQRTSMGAAGRQKAEAEFDELRVVDRVRRGYIDAHRRNNTDLPSALRETGTTQIRRADVADVHFLGGLHSARGGWRLLRSRWIARRFYEALINYDGGFVLVAEDESGPVGFAAGLDDMARFRTMGLSEALGSAGFVALWGGPAASRGKAAGPGRLLAVEVVPDARGRGVATELGTSLLSLMAERGVPTVRVVSPNADPIAGATLRAIGFSEAGSGDGTTWVAETAASERQAAEDQTMA